MVTSRTPRRCAITDAHVLNPICDIVIDKGYGGAARANPSSMACRKFTNVFPLTLKSSVTLYLHAIGRFGLSGFTPGSQNYFLLLCLLFFSENKVDTNK